MKCRRNRQALNVSGDRELNFVQNANFFPEFGISYQAGMFVLFERSARLEQTSAVPLLPGVFRQQRQAQWAKTTTLPLGGIFNVQALEPALQFGEQARGLFPVLQII